MVVFFEEDILVVFIELFKFDVLVKGGDYEISSIVGVDIVF